MNRAPSGAGVITDTNTFLLSGLKDRGNHHVWETFCSRYHPVLVSFARRLGLSEQDAEDAAQETLFSFADAYRKGQYDPDKGRLRAWLFGIARHAVSSLQRRNGRQHLVHPEDQTRVLDGVPDDGTLSEAWETEWQRAILGACMEEVRRHTESVTLRAFELFVLREWAAERVAAELGITTNAVFKAKRRVLTRLREAYRQLDENW